MSNRQAHKLHSMPVLKRSSEASPAPQKKNTTLSRLLQRPQQQQSFVDTSLSSEMKQKPVYQSDPNLLEESDGGKSSQKKGKGWKWPFPKNRNTKELPDPTVHGIQPISIFNKPSYFPDIPPQEVPFKSSTSHLEGSNVQEPENLVIAFQDEVLVTEIEPICEGTNSFSGTDRNGETGHPTLSPPASRQNRGKGIVRRESSRRHKKSLTSLSHPAGFESGPSLQTIPSDPSHPEKTNGMFIPNGHLSPKNSVGNRSKQPLRQRKSLMLCDYCLMTVSTPALYAKGEKGKGKEITFRFSPLAKIGLLRGAILREFLERTQSSPTLLSTLHLCYFNDRDNTWIWLNESLPLFTYNLQRECRLDLKPSTPHSTGVRIVLPDIERTMMVSYDQFTRVNDLLSQVLNAQKLRIKDTKEFSLFHVRLRIMLDPNRSLTYYEIQSHDTLECRIAPGKMECRSIKIHVPQTDTYHTVEVCLDQTVGDLISLLIRQLPSYDFSHWYHSALYYRPKEFGKGQWLDDYKYLYYYSIDPEESLEFKARYRPLVFDLHVYFSNREQSPIDRNVTLLLSQNILVQQVIELLHATCSFEFDTEFYGLYQHNGQQIPNEARLCEYLDNIANRRYEDTIRVQMIPMPIEVELVEVGRRDQEQCSIVTHVDFNRPCKDLRNLLARRFGVRNRHTCVICFEDVELDLNMSLFNNGVTEKSTVYFIHKELERRPSESLSPVVDYLYNNTTCTITPDLLADLPGKTESQRSKSLMLTDMPNIWEDELESKWNIRYVGDTKIVSAATFNKLIIRLTSDQELDLGFVKTFLLTYRAYTSPKILLQKLIERYNVIRSMDKSINEFNISRTKIQLRVINSLKFWLELGFDFQDDSSLQRQMMDFIDKVLYDDQPKMCRRLRSLLLIIQGKLDQGDKQNTREKPPPIKVNKSSLAASCLTELDPEEVARQLTLIDFDVYSKIKPFELLNQAWTKPKYKHKAKNVHCLVERLNNLTLWVATVILSYLEDYQRAKAISAFVKIAYHLYRLHNFSTLMAIYCGVQHGSITRLYRTWSKVDRSTNRLLEDLTIVCDPQLGHSKMREEMTNANPPCLPYIGLYMRDLTLIDEGNPNLMQDGLINFLKCDLIYKSIRDVQMYQQKNYNFEVELSINASLSSFQFVDEKTAYQHSELYEPRIRRV